MASDRSALAQASPKKRARFVVEQHPQRVDPQRGPEGQHEQVGYDQAECDAGRPRGSTSAAARVPPRSWRPADEQGTANTAKASEVTAALTSVPGEVQPTAAAPSASRPVETPSISMMAAPGELEDAEQMEVRAHGTWSANADA